MFAIIAAILFGVALLLNLIDTGAEYVNTFVIAGWLAIAVHLVLGAGAWPWRRT